VRHRSLTNVSSCPIKHELFQIVYVGVYELAVFFLNVFAGALQRILSCYCHLLVGGRWDTIGRTAKQLRAVPEV